MKPDFFSRPPPRAASYTVPHDRVGQAFMMIVHRAVAKAFEFIRNEGHSLVNLSENDVTETLEDYLVNRVYRLGHVEGFDTTFFGKVVRANELVNFDSTKKSKKPDLVFPLHREDRIDWDQRQDAIFAECKPVDKKHTLSGHYCAVGKDCTGIERFIVGDYAWAMEEAFMIGYVQGDFTIDQNLRAALLDERRSFDLGSPTEPEPLESDSLNSNTDRLHRTIHQRRFRWLSGTDASPIEIFHSWHNCG